MNSNELTQAFVICNLAIIFVLVIELFWGERK